MATTVGNHHHRDAESEQPLLLKVEQVALLLGIGRTRVYDLLRLGQLQSVKVFGSRRIPRIAVDAYVQALMNEEVAA